MLTAIFLAATAAVAAAEAGPVPIRASGGFTAISVSDVRQSAEWYGSLLGLEVVFQTPAASGQSVIALEGDGILIELLHDPNASAATKPLSEARKPPPIARGIFKAGFILSDYPAFLARLRQRNIPVVIGPFPASKEQRENLILRDPDGNYVQFFGSYSRPGD